MPLAKMETPRGVPQSEVDHFSIIPIVQSTLNDKDFEMFPMSRTLTHGGRGHTLMASTWNTDKTIAHLLSFFRPSSSGQRAEVRRYYTFGSGLNAHPDLLHGGVISCVLDSTMGAVTGLALSNINTGESGEEARGRSVFTAQLNVSYKAPVRTPSTVQARSWIKSVEDNGRKIWVEGIIEGGDDGSLLHARAEGLWIRAGAKGNL